MIVQAEWLAGLAGGLIIGTAAAMFLLVNGRIMGASGILGSVLDGTAAETRAEKLAFMAGLVGMPALLAWAAGGASPHLTANLGIVVLAGLLVGLGTRLANGCTSGHGVCGMSRLSRRSIVATVVYLLAGGLTMALMRHALGVI